MYISKLFLYVSGHLVNLEAAKEFELDLTRDISNLGENLSCLRSFEGRFPNSQPTATIEFFGVEAHSKIFSFIAPLSCKSKTEKA